MRRWALPFLLLLSLGLMLLLASMWLTKDGRWAGVAWTPPTPVKPALDAAADLPATGVELGRFVATLERPLFAPSRRPPPPPPAPDALPASDPPPDLRVLGLYGSGGEDGRAGGMIARVGGQVKRVRIGDVVERWTLAELQPGEAVLVQGDRRQAYPLLRAAPGETLAGPSADAGPERRPVAAPATNAAAQRQLEEARASVRRMNVVRARSGLPPLPEP